MLCFFGEVHLLLKLMALQKTRFSDITALFSDWKAKDSFYKESVALMATSPARVTYPGHSRCDPSFDFQMDPTIY